MYGEGISKEGGLLDVGVAMDVVTKTGAWFNFDETRLGQGREASKDFLQGQPGRRRGDRSARSAPRSTRSRSRSRASPRPNRPSPWPMSGRPMAAAGTAVSRFAERRERRAAVDDPAVVLEAAARFLEVAVTVGRRGPAPPDDATAIGPSSSRARSRG